jgi:hypothetical protein
MSNTFIPTAWLASFKSVGGAYCTDGQRLVLAIIPGLHPDKDMSKARLLVKSLTADQRQQVVRHLSAPVLVEG